jgi:hypothetical protein
MESTMKVSVLAKKLRVELKRLQAKRAKNLAAYDKAFILWLVDAETWLRKEVPQRIRGVTKKQAEEGWDYRYDGISSLLLKGAPKPPERPSDDRIRAIQNTLRYLGVTGQSTMRVCDTELSKWFGDT